MSQASRVLLATGLTGAIGQAVVELIHPSWHIIGIRRSPVNVKEPVEWVQADLRDPVQMAEKVQTALHQLNVRHIAGVVHLAGVVYSDIATNSTSSEWEQMMNVNLRSAFELVKIAKPLLCSSASIVFVSSVDALMASALGPAAVYGASKAGLEGLMRHLAAEWGEDGIRVNTVMVGALFEGMGVADSEESESIRENISLGRLGRAREIAPAIRFLLEDEQSSYITGHTLRVDGGLNLRY
ncbi:MAG: SDR family NAD(P)-dependent oxidoreductase [Firmicutes bacterium]|nr:SDR family NAD(P)-dependent oxidoreductase [Bacillota bacterium]MCL5013618.1 SDR family NAD(P)-dependent oxidoreductase [Bacillota bacterium]